MEKNKINQFGAIIAASTILMGFSGASAETRVT